MVTVYPNHSWAYDRLGNALYRQGRVEEATAAWIAAADRSSEQPQYLRKAAIGALELGRQQWADALWGEIIRQRPNDREAQAYWAFRRRLDLYPPHPASRQNALPYKESEKRVDGNTDLGEEGESRD